MASGPVGVVGLGVIGARWAAAFAHAGIDVIAHDPDPSAWDAYQSIAGALFDDLARIGGGGRRGSVRFRERLDEAFAAVGFVQENAPEDVALKQRVLPAIEAVVGEGVVIASSSSALLVSDLQRDCRHPERIVLGHPFNPAHLMPLVEIVGGEKTDPAAIKRAQAVYEAMGKKPVVLRREVTGHIAVRLMAAMWREAIALMASGAASAEDIDRAFCFGPAPKWLLQGSFISNHLGADGIEAFLEKYGPTYQAIWDTLGDARLDDATRALVAEQTRALVAGRSDDALRRERDAGLVEVLKVQSRFGAL